MEYSCEQIEEMLSQYQDGELCFPMIEMVRDHLGKCPKCTRTLQEINDVWSSLDLWEDIEPKKGYNLDFWQKVGKEEAMGALSSHAPILSVVPKEPEVASSGFISKKWTAFLAAALLLLAFSGGIWMYVDEPIDEPVGVVASYDFSNKVSKMAIASIQDETPGFYEDEDELFSPELLDDALWNVPNDI